MKDETQADHVEPENLPDPHDEDVADQAPLRGKGDFGALWILIVVIVMAGSTFWMIRDVWTTRPVASSAPANETPAAERKSADRDTTGQNRSMPVAAPAEAAHDAGQADIRQQNEARLQSAEQEAKRVEQERLEAEQTLEAERAARAALEQEQRAAEERLEAGRQARMALEAQRLKAEQELARERAERKALEQEAKLEQQKLMQARQAAEQAARERAQAEAQRQALEESAASAPELAIPGQPAVDADATPLQEASGAIQTEPVADAQADSDEAKFSSNPCAGPSAKFLSTCR